MRSNSHAPVSVIVLTYNEGRNLPACLESVVGWAREVVVVDSGSKDSTRAIASKYGARLLEHHFETHSAQWQWALENVPLSTSWILALDADQRVSPELAAEIAETIEDPAVGTCEIVAYFIKRRQIFRGKWIRHGGYYPKYLLKLFRRGHAVVDVYDLVDHHFRPQGKTAKLRCDLIEDNRNEADIFAWIDKHNRYALLQATEENGKPRDATRVAARFWGTPDERVAWLKTRWASLPLFLRPLLYFTYRYFFRLGLLDGREGFIFHFLQGFWYRLLVDIHLADLRSGSGKSGRRGSEPPVCQELERADGSRSEDSVALGETSRSPASGSFQQEAVCE